MTTLGYHRQMAVPSSHDASVHDLDRSRGAIASNIRRARLARGLSLRALEEMTGTSKALISQIERAEGNPTIAVLGRIAAALDQSIADLVRETALAPTVVRSQPASTGAVEVHTLFASMDRRRFEMSEGTLPPRTSSTKFAHGVGSHEYAVLIDGEVTVRSNGWEVELSPGDAIRFSAEFEHVYATGDTSARVLTIVTFDDV
jgi:transcriptional regulator with XRE-family HTH domain